VRERPPFPRINRSAPIWGGVAFAPLGGGAGTLAMLDSSGYGNHGLLTGYTGAGNTPVDRWGWAMGRAVLGFDGSTNYVQNSTFRFNCQYPFTLAAWMYSTADLGASIQTALSIGASSSQYFAIGFKSLSTYVAVPLLAGRNTGFDPLPSPVDVGLFVWTHVAGVFVSAASRLLYVNGALVATDTSSVTELTTGTRCHVGSNPHTGILTPFAGSIGDPVVLARAVPPAEIARLADPSNVMYRMGGVDGILDPVARLLRCFPVSAGGAPPAGPYRWPWQGRRARRTRGAA